jgi:predicted DNA-binding transcriptional regulator AlpA
MPRSAQTARDEVLSARQVAELTGYSRQHILHLGQEGDRQTDGSLYLIPVRAKPKAKRRVWAFRRSRVEEYMAGDVYQANRAVYEARYGPRVTRLVPVSTVESEAA